MQEFIFKQIEDGSYCAMRYKGDEEIVVIPEYATGVSILNDNLFRGHKEITEIRIPDSVTDIGEFVFDGCENLRQIKLPAQLKCLWGHTFTRSGIEEIALPDGIISIPPFAFKDCKNLKRVVCNAGLKKIYAWAFSGCDNLEEVVYGPNVEVSPDAFLAKD